MHTRTSCSFARLLENATALVVSNSQALIASAPALQRLCSPNPQLSEQDQLRILSVSHVLPESEVC